MSASLPGCDGRHCHSLCASNVQLHVMRVAMSLTILEGRVVSVVRSAVEHPLLAFVGDIGNAEAFVENQRGVALLMHLLNCPAPVGDVAIYCKRDALLIASSRDAAAWKLPSSVSVDGNAVSVAHVSLDEVCAAVQADWPVAVVSREIALQQGAWVAPIVSKVQTLHSATPGADAIQLIARSLAVKDDSAKACVQKAAIVCTATFKKFVVPQLQQHLNAGGKSMRAFSDEIEAVVRHPNRLPEYETLNTAHFSASFTPPLVQSGSYNLKSVIPAEISSNAIEPTCVCVGLGSRHQGYSAYCARTFLIDGCAPEVIKAYEFLLSCFEGVAKELAVGRALADVFRQVKRDAETRDASLAAKLGSDFGFSTGLHVLDAKAAISERATLSVQAGMMLTIRVVLENVATGDTTVSLVLADTVCIEPDGVKFLTKAKRTAGDVALRIDAASVKDEKIEPMMTRAAQVDSTGLKMEHERQESQQQIIQGKIAAWKRAGCPKGVQSGAGAHEEEKMTTAGRVSRGDVASYKLLADAEEKYRKTNTVAVDSDRETLWIPIAGQAVPFHVATVAKIDVQPAPGDKHAMTVTFATTQQSNPAFARHAGEQWVKEATIVGSSGGAYYDVVSTVKNIQQRIKTRDAAKKQSSGLAEATKLRLAAAPLKLPHVKFRPSPAAGAKGGSTGSLELHMNGFRFATPGASVDIPFNNIKHVIFQPAQQDVCVILHFSLKLPMVVAGKKVTEVQVAAEVVETSEAATARRSTYDQEVEAEDKDDDRVRRTNIQFGQFARKTQEFFATAPEASHLTVESPFKDYHFEGVGNKRHTKFRGDANVLWAINDLPFLTISVEDIEVVSLERVLPGQQNFDAMFIHKDYKTVTPITIISMEKLEALKDWMNEVKLVYFESTTNIAWTKLLKDMREDPDWEAWGDEGWTQYINPGGDEEGEEDDDDDDSEWESESGADDESSEEDSDWAEEGDSSSFGSDSSDVDTDDDDSEASWDEQERRAEAADRRRHPDSDSDGGRKRTRAPGKPAGRSAPQPPPRRR